jgi:hypothetical protein
MKEASPECCNSRKVFLMGHSMVSDLFLPRFSPLSST